MTTFYASLNPIIEDKQNDLLASYRKIDDLEVICCLLLTLFSISMEISHFNK
jgi:hypothetical protein